jgi:ligand-binding SRPBCC domain-containing protein
LVTIESEIVIHVPRDVCFDLARSIDAHVQSMRASKERIVGGRTTGMINEGETVTFEAVHLGVRQRLTSKIITMRRPDIFVDQMQRGAFQSMTHTHLFFDAPDGTLMRDCLEFSAPLGLLGRLAEWLVLRRYMLSLIQRHQRALREMAEGSRD